MADRNRFNDQSRYQQEVAYINRRDEEDSEKRRKPSSNGGMVLLGFIIWIILPTILWFKYLA